jgi:DNA adenine methylase
MKAKPFIRWVGGKRQLLPELLPKVPDEYNTYWEPFLGGGALFFALQPDIAHISDCNFELINAYQIIQKNPYNLIEELSQYRNEEDFYYTIRSGDISLGNIDPIKRAARFVYLNRTCFNGLYRVNKQGQFNVPYGHRKNIDIVSEENIMACHELLTTSNVHVGLSDFSVVNVYATQNDFVYFDPPYVPLTVTSNFTQYTKDGFSESDHQKLLNICNELTEKNVKWMQSNSSAPLVYELYKDYNIEEVEAKRNISASVSGRKPVKEVIITNY